MVQGFNPNPRERLDSSVGEASLPTEIPLLGVSQDILKDTVKALSPPKGPVCISPPFSITLELAKEAMWWVGFSLFFSSLAHRLFPTLVSLPLLSVIPLQATDSFYVVLFLSKSHMPIF